METSNVKATHNQSVIDELDSTAVELLERLARQEKENLIQPGEFTIIHYMAQMEKSGVSMSRSTARRRLTKMVDNGVLIYRKMKLDGGDTNVYRDAQVELEENE